MENKKRNFSFTAVKATNEKLEELNKPEVKEIIEGKNGQLDVSKIASTRIDAMEKFNLKPVTTGGKYELEKDCYDSFVYLAKKLNKTVQEMASEYVLEALKKDLKKYNIPVVKNN